MQFDDPKLSQQSMLSDNNNKDLSNARLPSQCIDNLEDSCFIDNIVVSQAGIAKLKLLV